MLFLLVLPLLFINGETCSPCPHHTTTPRPVTTVTATSPSSAPEISTTLQPETPPRPLTTLINTSPSSAPEISTPPQPETPPRPLTTLINTSPSSAPKTSSVPASHLTDTSTVPGRTLSPQ
ncbi:hypothetical protein Aduo_016242 [Ancylostoma duodenale]